MILYRFFWDRPLQAPYKGPNGHSWDVLGGSNLLFLDLAYIDMKSHEKIKGKDHFLPLTLNIIGVECTCTPPLRKSYIQDTILILTKEWNLLCLPSFPFLLGIGSWRGNAPCPHILHILPLHHVTLCYITLCYIPPLPLAPCNGRMCRWWGYEASSPLGADAQKETGGGGEEK